ncbi:hypothetical protein [uncultured Ramlibacter sp.]|uniref:hypothetical protein n=1 Tax=uncultured Ramlibacter sp. TaxID=260755 RepID=UPI00262A08B3|nr:hypothetical protein [uncultured Ramlibacter sp.]
MKLRLASTAFIIAVSGCASQSPPPPPSAAPVGPSALSPTAAADCIALKWATNARTPVWVETVLANGTAYNVYVPTQQPPAGSAALVRPGAGGVGSAVSFRGTDTSGLVPGIAGQCQS